MTMKRKNYVDSKRMARMKQRALHSKRLGAGKFTHHSGISSVAVEKKTRLLFHRFSLISLIEA